MSTGTIIVIAAVVVVVLMLLMFVVRIASRRRDERRREQAGELREQARSRSIQAESARASADEQAHQDRALLVRRDKLFRNSLAYGGLVSWSRRLKKCASAWRNRATFP